MKFTRSAPVRIGHISEVDTFVTDQDPPEAIIDICKNAGVQIEVANQPSEFINGESMSS